MEKKIYKFKNAAFVYDSNINYAVYSNIIFKKWITTAFTVKQENTKKVQKDYAIQMESLISTYEWIVKRIE